MSSLLFCFWDKPKIFLWFRLLIKLFPPARKRRKIVQQSSKPFRELFEVGKAREIFFSERINHNLNFYVFYLIGNLHIERWTVIAFVHVWELGTWTLECVDLDFAVKNTTPFLNWSLIPKKNSVDIRVDEIRGNIITIDLASKGASILVIN